MTATITYAPRCADCREPSIILYNFYGRTLCGDCKFKATEPDCNDHAADDPRRGQAAGLNALRRKAGE